MDATSTDVLMAPPSPTPLSLASPSPASSSSVSPRSAQTALRWSLLGVSAVLFALHFVHLTADFPNNSPWNDWSKYTDEGWYSDAAIRHFLLGHWFLPGDFNPGIVMPVWPLLEVMVFRFTGVSLSAARGLTVVVFGILLLAATRLIHHYEVRDETDLKPAVRQRLAAPLAVLFFCASSFFYAFDRLAIVEPLVGTLAVLALWTASCQRPERTLLASAGQSAALGIVATATVLAKPTAVTLLPAIGFLLWHRAGFRVRPALQLVLPPLGFGVLLWAGYYLLLVRPHFREDYAYFFAANAYTGFQLQPLTEVLGNTLRGGLWMGAVLYPLCFVLLCWLLITRPLFFRNPLVPALLLWIVGYFAFLAYHNNPQPRYYLVLAVPVTLLVALELDAILQHAPQKLQWIESLPRSREGPALLVAACVVAIVIPDIARQLHFIRHPTYTYVDAAAAIAGIVRADRNQSPLLLSVSGSDLTLMTGLPSINDDFGTLDLDERVQRYKPGWYVAWNQIDDDKMDALQPLYRPVRVAAFPAMDDPDRDLLILYRLDPALELVPHVRAGHHVLKHVRSRLGQQLVTTQSQR